MKPLGGSASLESKEIDNKRWSPGHLNGLLSPPPEGKMFTAQRSVTFNRFDDCTNEFQINANWGNVYF